MHQAGLRLAPALLPRGSPSSTAVRAASVRVDKGQVSNERSNLAKMQVENICVSAATRANRRGSDGGASALILLPYQLLRRCSLRKALKKAGANGPS